MTQQEIIDACKGRAAADYETFDTFVECYGDSEWKDFVAEMTQEDAFAMMDTLASVWSERRADAAHYANW